MCGMRCGSRFIFLTYGFSFFLVLFVDKTVLSPLNCLCTFYENQLTIYVALSGLSVLFHWCVCVRVHTYIYIYIYIYMHVSVYIYLSFVNTILLSWLLYLYIKSWNQVIWVFQTPLPPPKIVLAFLVPLLFHNFRITLSVSTDLLGFWLWLHWI